MNPKLHTDFYTFTILYLYQSAKQLEILDTNPFAEKLADAFALFTVNWLNGR